MIRFGARYKLMTEDFDAVDRFGDTVMSALILNDDILEPDLAISMTERVIEIVMIIDTFDAMEAIERGTRALREAFAGAGHRLGRAQVLVHESLLDAIPSVRAELVGVWGQRAFDAPQRPRTSGRRRAARLPTVRRHGGPTTFVTCAATTKAPGRSTSGVATAGCPGPERWSLTCRSTRVFVSAIGPDEPTLDRSDLVDLVVEELDLA